MINRLMGELYPSAPCLVPTNDEMYAKNAPGLKGYSVCPFLEEMDKEEREIQACRDDSPESKAEKLAQDHLKNRSGDKLGFSLLGGAGGGVVGGFFGIIGGGILETSLGGIGLTALAFAAIGSYVVSTLTNAHVSESFKAQASGRQLGSIRVKRLGDKINRINDKMNHLEDSPRGVEVDLNLANYHFTDRYNHYTRVQANSSSTHRLGRDQVFNYHPDGTYTETGIRRVTNIHNNPHTGISTHTTTSNKYRQTGNY